MPMPTFKITLAYDGTDYVGWQRQANGRFDSGSARRRAARARRPRRGGGRAPDAPMPASTRSGRSRRSRSSARLRPTRWCARSTRSCPTRSASRRARRCRPTFHPRFDARAKTYRYRIWNGDVVSPFERRYAWHVPGALDVAAMQAAARLLEGHARFRGVPGAGSDVTTTEREVFIADSLRIADCGIASARTGSGSP